MDAQSLEQLTRALAAELNSLKDVESALQAESDALRGLVPANLESAVADKSQALMTFAQLRSNREALLGQLNLEEALDAYAATDEAEHSNAKALLQSLDELGENCKELNQNNGLLIGGLKDRAERSLSLLRSGEAGVTLYGEGGNRDSDLGSRSLGTA